MRYGIFIEKNNEFNKIFAPLANRMNESLKNLGVYSQLEPKFSEFCSQRIIFGSHTNADFWLRHGSENDLIVNLEPVYLEEWRSGNDKYCQLLKCRKVIDYTKKNSPFTGEHHLLTLPPVFKSREFNLKTMDVLFVGGLDKKRLTTLQAMCNSGIQVYHGFRLFGRPLMQKIARAKIFLNINAENHSTFNSFRFSLTSSMDTLFMGDACAGDDFLQSYDLIEKCIFYDTESLIRNINQLLSNTDDYNTRLGEQQDLADVQDIAFQKFMEQLANK